MGKVSTINFTKTVINGITPPSSGRDEYKDERQANLRLRVFSTGTKSFVWYGKVQGAGRRYTLGQWPDMSIDRARKAAAKMNVERAEGVTPGQQIRDAKRAGETVGDIKAIWRDLHTQKNAKKTLDEYDRLWEKIVEPKWGNHPVKEMNVDDVEAWFLRVGKKHGHTQANRCLSLLSVIFNKTRRRPNPTHGIEKFSEDKRDRYVEEREMPTFVKALDDWHDQDFSDYIRLLLSTGQRRSAVCSMQWKDIDLGDRTWTIPADVRGNKAKKKMVLPLTDWAVSVLAKRREWVVGSVYVFPSDLNPTGHMVGPDRQWRTFKQHCGIEDLRLHDLRRTLGSWQHNRDVDQLMIARSLGQTSTSATDVYSITARETMRANMNKAVKSMRKRKAK